MKTPSGIDDIPITNSEDLAVSRSQELCDLIFHFAPKQKIDEFYKWLKEFLQYNTNFPQNKEIHNLLAKSLKEAIRLFGERKAFADMLYVLDELYSIYTIGFESETLSEMLAEAYAVAIFYLRGSWDIEGTSTLLKRLRVLLKKHPKNNKIAVQYAKSYSDAINRFCSDRHNFTCDKLLFELRMFANKTKDNESIQYEFAQALTSVIGTFAREERFEELEKVLNELRQIASRFPKSEKIQLLLTRGTILSSLADTSTE